MYKLRKLISNAPANGDRNIQRSHTNIHSRRLVQNDLLIWLDGSLDEVNHSDYRKNIKLLHRIFNNVNTFTDSEKCIDFLTDNTDEKIFMIISGTLAQRIIPIVHDISHVDSIYIFCRDNIRHEQWTKDWFKIQGVFTQMLPIYEALKEREHNAISISFVLTNDDDDTSDMNRDQLNQYFMYTQILKEILLTIQFKSSDRKDFIDYCRLQFIDNEVKLKIVNKLDRKYRKKKAIWWYTYECFLYPMLNQALRLMEVDTIVKMGFFIQHLHNHIKKLHLKQFGNRKTTQLFTVYRGQGLPKSDFKQMMRSKSGLISFNHFLSTSTNRKVSLHFAERVLKKPGLMGILFVMTIDPLISSTPFASISKVSFFQNEDEILFSMHTVFRIHDIKPINENNTLWQAELTQASDNDQELRALTERVRNDTEGFTEWDRLGRFFIKLGKPYKAQELYEALLKKTSGDHEKANIYNQLGLVKDNQKEYKDAITYCRKSLEIVEKHRPLDLANLAASHNNIGLINEQMGDYSNALTSHEKALEIRQKIFHSNHPELANSYNNFGSLYHKMNQYSTALSYHEKALEIRQKALPLNHPDLAMSYNNIGLSFETMEEYSKALSYHEKALDIRQKALPPNHPDLTMSYNNIHNVYEKMNQH